jgi:hypothetical protein
MLNSIGAFWMAVWSILDTFEIKRRPIFVLGLNLLLLLWLLCWLGRGRCSVLLFRKVYPALRYLKHDRPLLCVLDSLGSVQALLGVLPIFFRLAHHAALVRRYGIRRT